ncbi:tail fiber domain-containing protein [Emticicia agri]|uniref:Tail fiber domain-containing protein n=1 Tax=Emticicia agri TaxID=2492393 RepID=A0A4Q5LYM2_9BACT|nr:tail fiber domain-containing protein [Emticicia agri]RYU94789.1 tail fiber domain-containing protein [Emticicia agri]
MKKLLLCICVILLAIKIAIGQSGEISSQSIAFPKYTTSNRPSANTVGTGSVLFNTTENIHEYSNGTSWLNLVGTNSLPSGTNHQTLRNSGTNWVADDNFKNNGTNVWIGNVTPIASDFLTVTAPAGLNNTAIKGVAPSGYGVLGSSTSGYGMVGISDSFVGVKGRSVSGNGIEGESQTGYGVYGTSYRYPAVAGFSTIGQGVYGHSTDSYGVVAVSAGNVALLASSVNGYSAYFDGKLKVFKGANTADAGIDFSSNSLSDGYIGMRGNSEMGIFGYGLNDWIQRWNVYSGSICYATTPTICSDIRLKKDFRPVQNSSLRLSQLKGFNYLWKNEKMTDLQTGFIAQEIQKIFPELVTTDAKGFLSVNYVGLIPHLVEANKILQKQNEDLLSRVERLEKVILAQETTLNTPKTKK